MTLVLVKTKYGSKHAELIGINKLLNRPIVHFITGDWVECVFWSQITPEPINHGVSK